MRCKTLLIVLIGGGLLAIASLAAARSKPAASDVLSGTWVGDMGPNETERHAITVTMKVDGKTVTGHVAPARSAVPHDRRSA